VRLLLDTHTLLWFFGGDAALSPYARQLIEDRTNERLLSIASLWEMAIKVSLGGSQSHSRSRPWWRSMCTAMR
jgi:PIN domain nuclease of toxin-antitoxin system